jgi:aerobic carbon-monoxide dehydrogenase large subunit
MVATEEKQKMIGQRLKRKEDPRFITGKGTYVEDVKLPGMLHAAVLRSPYAHATIRSIDTSAAARMPGVVGVFVGEDIDLPPLPYAWQAAGVQNNINTPTVLAKGEVHWIGDPVAVAVAETIGQARDAIEAIDVDFEVLPVVVDAEQATHEGAPQLHDNAPNNVAFVWSCGKQEATDQALGDAEVVIRQRIRNQRLIATPIETRGAVCQYNAGTEEFTFWLNVQAPHVHRLVMAAFVLGVPEQNIRVIAPDIGGAFGSKIFMYTEQFMVGWLARKLGRPVKWIETRSECNIATAQGRDHVSDIEIGAKRDGTVTALKVKTWANLGAYLSTAAGGVPTTLYGRMVAGVYQIPNIHVEVVGTYTNTCLVDAYRGAGRPEATYVVERAMDLVADELGHDPVEVRRKNFIPSDAFPFDTGIGMLPYDSGDYPKALDRALQILNYDGLKAEQDQRRAANDGKYLGIGFSTYVETCGIAPTAWITSEGWGAGLFESANVKVHLTGKVVVTTGSMPHGQGHETTFSQVVADKLGVPYEDIQVKFGDTLAAPMGYGTYGSRSLAVGGEAIVRSTNKIVEKGKRLAAHLLEVAEDDIEFEGGIFRVKGSPDQSKTIQEIALSAAVPANMPAGMEPFLDETTYFDPVNATFPFGTHIAVVEVDAETGNVDLKRYVAVDDVGNIVNPLIVNGQLQGGIVQGIGQALWESAVYDEDGQLLTGTLMEYAMPHAEQFPMLELDHTVTPAPDNELGAKGAGEAGTIASTPAVVNAVMDALSPLGIRHVDMPLSPPRVWAAIQEARARA